MSKLKQVGKAVLGALKSQPARKAETTIIVAVLMAVAKALGIHV